MKKSVVALWMSLSLAGTLLSGCTQMPTEKQGVADLRPQLSFKSADDTMFGARVLVDGLDMGTVGEYAEGSATLRVLSGNHIVRVNLNGVTIVDEKVYLGDGVNRTIVVK